MKSLLLVLFIIPFLVVPVHADAFLAPIVPESGEALMPDVTDDFGTGLLDLFYKAINKIHPSLNQALSICVCVILIVVMISVVENISGTVNIATEYAGALAVSATLLFNTNAMIQLTGDIIHEMCEYGKLLFPVMTAAVAAQGGISTSAAIYTGVSVFSSMLSMLIANVFLPMVYLYIGICVANSALGDELLKNLRDMLKQVITWSLKILLTVFTTYISITGVISGATDAAALKAAKVTISTFVPVVGGILSDASEAVLVSVGFAKNAAGIYGIFAILAIFLKPFLQIGVHYLLLKIASGISCIFGSKRICALVGDFSAAMGLLLAMTGTNCVLLLIAAICFMKGVG